MTTTTDRNASQPSLSLDPTLRELDHDAFERRYGADRFTTTVLVSRMRFVVEHMSTGLLNNAFSPIIRDWYDFNATVTGPQEMNYPMPAVGNSLAAFFGTMSEAVRNMIEEFGPDDVRPGDVIIANDPYRLGNHVNDVCFVRPVFVDEKVVSYVTVRAHKLDMGGTVPAGFSATKRNVYETGLTLAPILLYRDDKPIRSTFNVLLDNIRMGPVILPDIKIIYQSLLLAERLIKETVRRYGVEAYFGAMQYAVDVSAESMGAALAALPDGEYAGEDKVDCDAVDDSVEYGVKVAIRKVGDRMEVDLSGTSPQARTSINASALDAKAAIVIALKLLIDPASPYTSGAFRNIDVVLPPGTLVSATPPDGAIFLFWEATQPLITAIFGALDAALGPRAVGGDFGSMSIHNANGVLPDGTPWGSTAQSGGEHGPWGATRHGDADSYQCFYQANGLDPATEVIESEVPVLMLRKEYVPDSAGAGINRGGAAVRKDTLYLAGAEHWTNPLSTKRESGIGVNGGSSGARSAVWLFGPESIAQQDLLGTGDEVYAASTPVAGVLDPDTLMADPNGRYFYFASNPIWRTAPNSLFRYHTGGGGGWGNRLEREPERVCRDVRDEYVTIRGAYDDYGVVIVGDPHTDPEGLRIDDEATRARRDELAGRSQH